MPDHDAAPDPMDKAYAQAEAVLSDEDARAARRARILAAVAREPATPAAAPSPPARRPLWRRGGWLVAASVAGVSLYLTTQLYPPELVYQPPTPTTGLAEEPPPGIADLSAPAATAAAPTQPSAADALAVAPQQAAPPPPSLAPRAARAPAPPPSTPAPRTHAAAAPPPAQDMSEMIATSQRREADAAAAPGVSERRAQKAAPNPALMAPAAPPPALRSSATASPGQAARLHAAAAAGRTAELTALLAQGVPVDAPDAEGETALMKSIQAEQPAAAALLRRHGASLDRQNAAGDSARDMAAEVADSELDQALGLDR